ncbi:hypothetical protein FLLO111716_03545 [Flavobacterium longum]|uniref:hypothetical protein n=1 Tax=Flavobacterium longum TaxID=1299340 RepID=UPI0039E752AA
MKKLIVIVIVIFSLSGFAQPQPEIVAPMTGQRMIPAIIDGKYQITIFLQYEDADMDARSVYSVSGWYVYDNKQIRIPLVGIYCNGLTLYSFASDEKRNQVTTLQVEGNNVWERAEKLQNLSGYDEKFTFAHEGDCLVGSWQKGNRKLPVGGVSADEIAVWKEREFLRIPQKEEDVWIDLRQLNLYIHDFTLEGFYRGKEENRALLKYDCPSRDNVQGMCGAGQEIGYVTLHFDEVMNLESIDDDRVESCLNGFTHETDTKDPNKIIVSPFGDKPKVYYRIDAAKAQIIKLKQ